MRDFTANEQQPLFWMNGRPIYAALLIVLVYVATLLVTTILMGLQIYAPLEWMIYSSEAVLRGEVWRILTYGLWNQPSLRFVIDMFMIAWFGRELEKFFGRRLFLLFFTGLYLLTPLLFTAIGTWFPQHMAGEVGSLAIFVAFATLYPEAEMYFGLLAKWIALIFVGLYTLMFIANRDTAGLISLWATTGFAYAFVRYQQGSLTLPRFRFRRAAAQKATPVKPAAPAVDDLDAVLDKIARSGIASLTAAERARLEAGRAALLRRKDSSR
ncbi:MAG: rhomboid family intramembrane serine protease [Verrucomicrobia bacterium]|nr:rhomboid family intramembrane serine protease [Verrucomicrobiota bacterium]